MKVLLTGATGGIGSAIKEMLKDHEVMCIPHADIETGERFDWMICAHGVMNESGPTETFLANTVSNIRLASHIKADRIIFISSTAAKGNDRYPIYAASKAALNVYCKSISKSRECYVLAPGPTDTPMWRKLGLEGRAQSPKEVADAVRRIMTSVGVYNSGDIITVRDGEITV